MLQNHKNGQTTQTSNVKTSRLLWVNNKSLGIFKAVDIDKHVIGRLAILINHMFAI